MLLRGWGTLFTAADISQQGKSTEASKVQNLSVFRLKDFTFIPLIQEESLSGRLIIGFKGITGTIIVIWVSFIAFGKLHCYKSPPSPPPPLLNLNFT